MTRIAVLDDWQDVARGSADWSPVLARAEIQFFHAPFGGEDAAAQAPNLRMFGLTGQRAALVDVAALIARGVTVCYTGGGPSAASTAEIALGLMLAAVRRIPAGDAAVRDGRFQQGTSAGPVLAGKIVGLIGLGRIGVRMARYSLALDMNVMAWSQNLTAEAASAAGATLVSKDDLLSSADIVSLHLVLSERTRGILGAAELSRMKAGAILVNTARAALVDEVALIDAVQSGRLIAALDVFHREPLAANDPLARAANTVLTPHFGYSAVEVYMEYYRHAVENVLAFLDGRPIRVLEAPKS